MLVVSKAYAMESAQLQSYIFEHIQIKCPQELYCVKQCENTCCAEKLKFISLLMVYRCCKGAYKTKL